MLEKLSDIEKKLIEILAKNGEIRGSAQLGFMLWPMSEKINDRRTPQGMALAAGKVARRLIDNSLITAQGQPAIYKLTHKTWLEFKAPSQTQLLHHKQD